MREGRTRPRLVPALLAALALTHARPLPAAQGRSAEALYQQGVELFAQGSLDASVAALERARRRTGDRRLLARIELYLGLNAATDRRQAVAREHFRRAVRHDPELRPDPQQHKPEFVRLFEQVRQEEAVIARRLLGAPGPTSRSTSAPARQPVARAPGAPFARPRIAVADASAPRPRPRRRIWTWVVAGTAVATAAAAIGVSLSGRADYQEACSLLVDSTADCASRRTLRQESDRARFEELYHRVGTKSLAANSLWGIAGGLAVTSLVLFFVEKRESRRPPPAAVRLGFGPMATIDLSY